MSGLLYRPREWRDARTQAARERECEARLRTERLVAEDAAAAFVAPPGPYILVAYRGVVARLIEVHLTRAGYTTSIGGFVRPEWVPYAHHAVIAQMRVARPALLICYPSYRDLLELLFAGPDLVTVPVLVLPWNDGLSRPDDIDWVRQCGGVRFLESWSPNTGRQAMDELLDAVSELIGPPPGRVVEA